VCLLACRSTFGPAVLAALGDRAWSMPRWLDRVLPVIDVEGTGHDAPGAVTPPADSPKGRPVAT
jgi:RND superfamily putative drug exporter